MARTFYLLALLAVIVAGCDQAATARKKMEGPRVPMWPALQAMQGEGGMMTIGMGMDTQGPKAAQQAAAAPRFKELLDAFEKEAIPSSFSTAAREAAKKDVVESLRKLAEATSDDDIKALWTKARERLGVVIEP